MTDSTANAIPADILLEYQEEVKVFYEKARKSSKASEFAVCGIDLDDPGELLKVATAMLALNEVGSRAS